MTFSRVSWLMLESHAQSIANGRSTASTRFPISARPRERTTRFSAASSFAPPKRLARRRLTKRNRACSLEKTVRRDKGIH